jgi:hypothetical protein
MWPLAHLHLLTEYSSVGIGVMKIINLFKDGGPTTGHKLIKAYVKL